MSGQQEKVSIAEVIGEVRRQLEQAVAEGADSSLKFEVGPVKLTFTVQVEKTTGGEGAVQVWILQVGAKRDSTRSSAQTVTVTLSPYQIAPDGTHVQLDVARPRVGRPDGTTQVR